MSSSAIYGISATTLSGESVELSRYRGQVMLIVNTASKCGFTPQYEGLERLHQEFHARGLAVLGFPCDQFGHQEPGGAEEIASFCQKNYGVSFQMFDKVDVNGNAAHPLYKYLTSAAPGVLGTEGIKWNFTKFLVDREGNVVKRYAPTTAPEDLVPDLRRLLGT